MSNPSLIWGQLSMPNPPAGGIPFVATDNASIITDVLNLNYDQLESNLTITNGITVALGIATVSGAVTINNIAGSFIFPSATSQIKLTNSLINSGDLLFLQPQGFDATATRFSVVCYQGYALINSNAASTQYIAISFLVIKGVGNT